jgi:hypothetical protein
MQKKENNKKNNNKKQRQKHNTVGTAPYRILYTTQFNYILLLYHFIIIRNIIAHVIIQ